MPGTPTWSRCAALESPFAASPVDATGRAFADEAISLGQPRVSVGQLGRLWRRRIRRHSPEREGQASRSDPAVSRSHCRRARYRLVPRTEPPLTRHGSLANMAGGTLSTIASSPPLPRTERSSSGRSLRASLFTQTLKKSRTCRLLADLVDTQGNPPRLGVSISIPTSSRAVLISP